MNYTFEQLVDLAEKTELRLKVLGNVLQKYPRNALGLVSDDIKASNAYQVDRQNYDREFQRLRSINSVLTSTYKKELRAYRNQKKLNKLNGKH